MALAGPFHCEVWLEKVSLANLQIKVSLPLADCLSLTHTHIFPGSTSHFTAYWVTWCDTSAIYWQIWDSWGKECFLTFPPSPHAPLAPNRGKMKTNTVGFVVRQKPAALNLHDSSHSPSGTCWSWAEEREKRVFPNIFLFVYVVKCDNVCLETEFIIMWKSERTRVLKLLCNQMIYYQFEQTFFSFLWFHFTLLLRAICSYVH